MTFVAIFFCLLLVDTLGLGRAGKGPSLVDPVAFVCETAYDCPPGLFLRPMCNNG